MNPTEGEVQSLSLENIKAPSTPPPDVPDEKTLREEETYEQALAAEKVRSFAQNVDERKRYASKIYWMVATWLALLIMVLMVAGAKQIPAFVIWPFSKIVTPARFELSDKVLIALIAGTTVDLIGLFLVVANYLFRHPSKASHSGKPHSIRSRSRPRTRRMR